MSATPVKCFAATTARRLFDGAKMTMVPCAACQAPKFATVVVMAVRNVTTQNAAHGTKFSAGYDDLLPATKSGDGREP